MSCWSRIHFTEIVYLCYALGCILSFNVLLCLELVINCVVGGWVGVVCKPILEFSLHKAEQLFPPLANRSKYVKFDLHMY